MDPYNKAQTERVWRRVLDTSGARSSAAPGPPGGGTAQSSAMEAKPAEQRLLSMLGGVRGAAVCYLALSRRVSGRAAGLLHRLYEEKQNQADCLAGLYYLIQGKRPAPGAPKPPGQEPLDAALRKCYGGEMRLLAALESAAGLPEYGPVFGKLAQQTQEHCRLVLELLGRSGRG